MYDIRNVNRILNIEESQIFTNTQWIFYCYLAPDLTVVTERDEEVASLEKALETAEDKLQELEYKVADLNTDKKHLQKDAETLETENKVHNIVVLTDKF